MTQRTSSLTATRPGIQARGGRKAEDLSLRQPAPRDWHHDPPAYAGDPYMDWESKPERPGESDRQVGHEYAPTNP